MMSDVEALLREREGYARFGRTGRVAEVDAVLKSMGLSVSDKPLDVDEVGDDLETADAAPVKHRRKS